MLLRSLCVFSQRERFFFPLLLGSGIITGSRRIGWLNRCWLKWMGQKVRELFTTNEADHYLKRDGPLFGEKEKPLPLQLVLHVYIGVGWEVCLFDLSIIVFSFCKGNFGMIEAGKTIIVEEQELFNLFLPKQQLFESSGLFTPQDVGS